MSHLKLSAKLDRTDSGTSWGFRMAGGKDFGSPLILQKVIPGSLASKCGLQEGDAITRICGVPTDQLRHKEAQQRIIDAGNSLELTLERGGGGGGHYGGGMDGAGSYAPSPAFSQQSFGAAPKPYSNYSNNSVTSITSQTASMNLGDNDDIDSATDNNNTCVDDKLTSSPADGVESSPPPSPVSSERPASSPMSPPFHISHCDDLGNCVSLFGRASTPPTSEATSIRQPDIVQDSSGPAVNSDPIEESTSEETSESIAATTASVGTETGISSLSARRLPDPPIPPRRKKNQPANAEVDSTQSVVETAELAESTGGGEAEGHSSKEGSKKEERVADLVEGVVISLSGESDNSKDGTNTHASESIPAPDAAARKPKIPAAKPTINKDAKPVITAKPASTPPPIPSVSNTSRPATTTSASATPSRPSPPSKSQASSTPPARPAAPSVKSQSSIKSAKPELAPGGVVPEVSPGGVAPERPAPPVKSQASITPEHPALSNKSAPSAAPVEPQILLSTDATPAVAGSPAVIIPPAVTVSPAVTVPPARPSPPVKSHSSSTAMTPVVPVKLGSPPSSVKSMKPPAPAAPVKPDSSMPKKTAHSPPKPASMVINGSEDKKKDSSAEIDLKEEVIVEEKETTPVSVETSVGKEETISVPPAASLVIPSKKLLPSQRAEQDTETPTRSDLTPTRSVSEHQKLDKEKSDVPLLQQQEPVNPPETIEVPAERKRIVIPSPKTPKTSTVGSQMSAIDSVSMSPVSAAPNTPSNSIQSPAETYRSIEEVVVGSSVERPQLKINPKTGKQIKSSGDAVLNNVKTDSSSIESGPASPPAHASPRNVGGAGVGSPAGPWRPQIPTGPRTMKVGRAGEAKTLPASAGGSARIPICSSCGTAIRGPFVSALDKTWCPDHFTCANPSCRAPLINIGFVEEEGQLFCESDYEQYFAPRCGKCGRAIVGDLVNVGLRTKHYHSTCYVCFKCNQPITDGANRVRDGQSYCDKDWGAMFQTKCYGCQFPIEPGDRWVEALSNNWHSECFNCSTCQVSLEGQSFVAKNGKPYCKKHGGGGRY